MEYFVYILRSDIIGRHYCGQTNSITHRLKRHNNGDVKSTKHGIPWVMLGYMPCTCRTEAVQLEKVIKKRGIERWLNVNIHLLKKISVQV